MKLSKQHSNYQSEITQFIAALKEKNPNLEESQRAGRALLWDKAPIDLDQTDRVKDSRVQQQPYPYQNKVRINEQRAEPDAGAPAFQCARSRG
jgi:hypothetical protein